VSARAWALAAQTNQPRLIPPHLWAPTVDEVPPDDPGNEDGPAILEGESAVAYAHRRMGELAAEAETPPEPPQDEAGEAPEPEPEHRYPRRAKRATRAAVSLLDGVAHGGPFCDPATAYRGGLVAFKPGWRRGRP